MGALAIALCLSFFSSVAFPANDDATVEIPIETTGGAGLGLATRFEGSLYRDGRRRNLALS